MFSSAARDQVMSVRIPQSHIKCHDYREISNIRRTKSPNLNVSRLVLKLSLPNPMKPGVKSMMKMYIWEIDNIIA